LTDVGRVGPSAQPASRSATLAMRMVFMAW
jgi:hypothetical protein